MAVHFRPPILADERSNFGAGPLAWATQAAGYSAYFNDFDVVSDASTANPANWVSTSIGTPAANGFGLNAATDTRGSMTDHNPGTTNSTGTSLSGPGFYMGPVGTAKTVDLGFYAKYRVESVAGITSAVGLSAGNAQLTTAGAVATSNTLQFGLRTTTGGLASFYIANAATSVSVSVPVTRFANGATLADNEMVEIVVQGRLGLSSGDIWTSGGLYCYYNGVLVPFSSSRKATFVPGDITIDVTTAPGLFVTLDAVNAAGATGDAEHDAVGYWFRRW